MRHYFEVMPLFYAYVWIKYVNLHIVLTKNITSKNLLK